MGFLISKVSLCFFLVLLAYGLELSILQEKLAKIKIKNKIIMITLLIISSIGIFTYHYTDTFFDAVVVVGVVSVSFILMIFTMFILNTKLRFQHIIFFIIHIVVGILLTGVKSHILINYPSWLFGSYVLFSLTYYLYKSREKLIVGILVGVIISVRLIYAYDVDFNMFNKPDIYRNTREFVVVHKTKPTNEAVKYFKENFSRGYLSGVYSLPSNPKKDGVVMLVRYRIEGKDKNIRLMYKDGEITEE